MESEGVSEAAATSVEASKQEAKSMLEAGSSLAEIEAATGLGRNQILGLKGSIAKANKKALEKTEAEPSNLGKANQEEETLVNDLRDESKLTAAALNLGRNRNRLRQAAPELYDALHGKETQAESSPSRTLIDLEVLREIKAMRAQDEGSHRNNGDSNSRVSEMQRELNELKDKLAKKDIENLTKQTDDLREEVKELRADVRGSAGVQSDLAIVVREGKDLLVKALESSGPIRSYLVPSTNFVRPKEEAPLVRAAAATPGAPGQYNFLEEMRRRGLVTRVVDLQKGGP